MAKLGDELEYAVKRWPDQPLIMLEIDGDPRVVPIGHLFSFTGSVDSVRITGLRNGDGSLVVPRVRCRLP